MTANRVIRDGEVEGGRRLETGIRLCQRVTSWRCELNELVWRVAVENDGELLCPEYKGASITVRARVVKLQVVRQGLARINRVSAVTMPLPVVEKDRKK